MNSDKKLSERLCGLIVGGCIFLGSIPRRVWQYWSDTSKVTKAIWILILGVMAAVFLVYDIVAIGIALKTFFMVTAKAFILGAIPKIPFWIAKAFGTKIAKVIFAAVALTYVTEELVKRLADTEVRWSNALRFHLVEQPKSQWGESAPACKDGDVITYYLVSMVLLV